MNTISAREGSPESGATSPCARGSVGRQAGVLSIALFIFLFTFSGVISPVKSTPTWALWTMVASMITLLMGAVCGLVGIIYGQKPDDRGSLVIGIVGLCVNGLFLFGFLMLIFFAAMATVIRLHRTASTPASVPTQVYYRPVMPPVQLRPLMPYQHPVLVHHTAFR